MDAVSETYQERWGWYITLDAMSNTDFTKWPYLLSLNVVEFLNYVSFIRSKTEHEKQELERIRNKR